MWDALRLPFKVILEYPFINVQKENLKIIIKKPKATDQSSALTEAKMIYGATRGYATFQIHARVIVKCSPVSRFTSRLST